MSELKLFLFGAPRLEQDGQAVPFNLRKGQALLAYLAETGRAHSRDFLAALFWPENDQAGARGRLRRTLYRISQTLGEDLLLTAGDTVELNPEAGLWVDSVEARRLLAPPGRGQPPPLADLEAGVALATADFMAGFSLEDCPEFDEWQFFQQTEWRQMLAQALVQLVEAYQANGEWEPAIAAARRWLALDPLHEPAHRHLMSLYALAGQQAAALRQYEQAMALLDEELGVEPEEETTALYEAIRTRQLGPAADGPQTGPALPRAGAAAARGPRHNLPAESTPFVGREEELAYLERCLETPEARLVTLVGPGGIGKTRLALAAARWAVEEGGGLETRPADSGTGGGGGFETHPTFGDGVYFVPLAALDEPGQVVHAIAGALAFTFESNPRRGGQPEEQLAHYLAQKKMLLILDNFEQLLDAADYVAELLRTAPGLKVIVTSRERLYLRDEHLLVVGGLALPPEDDGAAPVDAEAAPAVRLFVQSARRVRPNFVLDERNVGDVVAICRTVEGMPLAVELAAAWVDSLPVAEIAAELRQSYAILETNLRDVPARQRSIKAVFETTWQRLEPDEQRTFAQLSVFRGGFTRAAAEAVAGTTVRMLQRLTGKSLLKYSQRLDRYYVHEMLRQCGEERLDGEEEAAARDRHSAFFCAALRRWQDDIEGAHKRDALLAIDQEADNVRAAWQWALAHGQLERLEQAMCALEHWFYWRSVFHKAEAFYEEAARAVEARMAAEGSRQNGGDALVVRVQVALAVRHANFSYLLNSWDEARAQFERGLARLRELAEAGEDVRQDEAYVLMKMGDVTTDLDEAEALFSRSLALYEEVGHRWWSAGLCVHLGLVALARGDTETAQRQFREGLARYEALGDRWQFGWVNDGLSHVALAERRLDEAERLARESLALHREIGLRDRIADSLMTLSWITLAADKVEESRALREEAMAIWRNLGIEDRVALPAGLEDQPLTPRWFAEVIDQRMAAVEGAVEASRSA